MNIIIIESDETSFSRNDIRYQHIRKILKLEVNDEFQCGIINGETGKAIIDFFSEEKLAFHFIPLESVKPFENLSVLLGTPRPPVAKRLLKDLTSMGINRICFVKTDLGEKSYLESNLWKNDNFMKHLIEGAQQGGSTGIPEVYRFYSVHKAVEFFKTRNYINLIHCDLPEYSEARLFDFKISSGPTLLAVGPERGWSEDERNYFTEKGFNTLSLNNRIMRTESAAILAAGILLNKIYM